MSVHRLTDGRWYVQWRDGQRWRRQYFGRGLSAEAEAIAANEALGLRKHEKRTATTPGKTLADLADAYLADRRKDNSASTLKALGNRLEKTILPALGDLLVPSLTPERINAYCAKRQKTVKRTTIHREVSDLIAILNFGVRNKYILVNPLAGWKKPKKDDEVSQPPTPEERAAIFSAAEPHLRVALAISAYCGLRPGCAELFSLRWSDINWTDGIITVTSAKKGGLNSRRVPMHPKLVELLRWWQKTAPGRSPYIVAYKGRRVESIKTTFAAAKRKAGITRRLRLYDFRHLFATTALENGADLKATSMILGHSSPRTTTATYQHVCRALERDVIARIPDIF